MIQVLEHLPFWLQGVEIVKIAKAAASYWQKINDALELTLRNSLSPDDCHQDLIGEHGWERRSSRFSNEDLPIYRQRLRDVIQYRIRSGSAVGLSEVLSDFGVTDFQIIESTHPEFAEYNDPDVVEIRMPDGAITANQELLLQIIQEYGLTCRKYVPSSTDFTSLTSFAAEGEIYYSTDTLRLAQLSSSVQETATAFAPFCGFGHETVTERVGN